MIKSPFFYSFDLNLSGIDSIFFFLFVSRDFVENLNTNDGGAEAETDAQQLFVAYRAYCARKSVRLNIGRGSESDRKKIEKKIKSRFKYNKLILYVCLNLFYLFLFII